MRASKRLHRLLFLIEFACTAQIESVAARCAALLDELQSDCLSSTILRVELLASFIRIVCNRNSIGHKQMHSSKAENIEKRCHSI